MVICVLAIILGTTMAVQNWIVLFGYLSGWMSYFVVLASAIIWTLMVIFSIFGYVGVWFKRRDYVSLFYNVLWGHIWLSVLTGIWSLSVLSATPSKPLLIFTCVNAVTHAKKIIPSEAEHVLFKLVQKCESDTTLWLIFLAFLWAACVLVELFLILTVGHTMDELEDWDAAHAGFDLEGPLPSSYVFARSLERERRHHHHHYHHGRNKLASGVEEKEIKRTRDKWAATEDSA
ncbi:hypothetical protein OIV83_001057 [Microbotryomycetes sp. JL201]|nr:hypothetical protein OIV83_001057 [Microbotryomycetes sp. JL201]